LPACHENFRNGVVIQCIGHTGLRQASVASVDGIHRLHRNVGRCEPLRRIVWSYKSTKSFSFPQCHVIYKLCGVAARTHQPQRSQDL